MKKVVYVGSFDPAHLGHLNTFRKIQEQFPGEKVVVAICKNDLKEDGLFTLEERKMIAEDLFLTEVEVASGPKEICTIMRNADVVARGIKNDSDLQYINKLIDCYKLDDCRAKLFCVRIDEKYFDYSSSNIKKYFSKEDDRVREMLSPLAYDLMRSKCLS